MNHLIFLSPREFEPMKMKDVFIFPFGSGETCCGL